MNKPYKLSVKAIVLDPEKRCLLLRRPADSGNFPGKWDLPGGKLDRGEDFLAALEREAREETGLKLQISGLAGATEFELPTHRTVLLCMAAQAAPGPIRLSDEHAEFAWVPLPEVQGWDIVDHLRPVFAAYIRSRQGAKAA